jgi:hypothetical protein
MAAPGDESESDSDASCPDELLCPLTLTRMREPTMLSQSGTTYEGSALRAALARRPGIDPLSNASFEGEPHLVVVLGSFSREQRPAPEGEVDLPDAAHLDEASLMSDVETITLGDVA